MLWHETIDMSVHRERGLHVSSRTARNLVAYIDGKLAVTLRTSADYAYAGIAPSNTSPTGWVLLTKGFARDSVDSRTRTQLRKWARVQPNRGVNYRVVSLHDELVKPIAEYFAERPLDSGRTPTIMAVFIEGQGWFHRGEAAKAGLTKGYPTRARLRHLRDQFGVTHVSVGDDRRHADFRMTEFRLGRMPSTCPLLPQPEAAATASTENFADYVMRSAGI
jgi:hypothetical protein